MKKLLFFALALFVITQSFGQNLSTIPVAKIDTVKLNKVSAMKLDTMTNLELAFKVIQQDSVVKTQQDTISAKETALQAQKEVSESVINHIKDGTLSFIDLINWLFIIVYVVITWLFNDLSAANNTAKWLNWFNKIPKMLRSFLMGLFIAILFYWVFGYNERLDVFALFCSILMGMVIYKIGIDKIFSYISKYWLKLNFESKSSNTQPEPPKPQ